LPINLLAFSEELLLQNIPFRTEVLEQQELVPEPRVTALLNLAGGESLFYLQRRRFVNDSPIILTNNYVRLDLCPGIEQEDFTKQRLLSCMEKKFGLHLSWARRTFEARAANAEQSEWLNLPVGAPLMYLEQIVYLEDGRPVECSDIWIPGDRFRLSSITARGGKQTLTNSWRRGDLTSHEVRVRAQGQMNDARTNEFTVL